jgi:hypothetical protein
MASDDLFLIETPDPRPVVDFAAKLEAQRERVNRQRGCCEHCGEALSPFGQMVALHRDNRYFVRCVLPDGRRYAVEVGCINLHSMLLEESR